ncbi:S1 family peptidase [Actinocrispum wychmicini]|uniref:S1 family peptidase n=1 Tax=Actinocrispum wychmicini TaxID=1213861 RepID=UPI0014048F86|nr:S1 family peptidase [Actinocrispum wychmicini]
MDEPRPVISRKILLGLVVGVTVAAAITAMAAAPRPPAETQTVAVGAASALDPGFRRDEQLTPQQARDLAKQQAVGNRALAGIRRKLGVAYAGAWFDSTSRRLTVGVIDRSRVDEVRAMGAEPRLVEHNLLGLQGAKTRLDRFGERAPVSVVSWYVDPPTNTVVIEARKDQAAEEFITRARGVGDMVRVEWTSKVPRTFADVLGGGGFTIGDARCSVGFSATGPNGTRHVITAGHCTQEGSLVLADGQEFGRVSGGTFDADGDFGLIDITDSDARVTSFVDTRDGGPVVVTGTEPAALGASVCRSGSSSGFACGEVVTQDETVNYGNGSIVRGLSRMSVCAEPGDSGGAVVSGTQAQGVMSGGVGDCASGGTTFFQPIQEAATKLGVSVVTS